MCGPQNGDKWPKMAKNTPKQPKMDKSGHFASQISHYPLYIFAYLKIWDDREHHELQSDGFGLCSKKS
jgi:hypothetical protein